MPISNKTDIKDYKTDIRDYDIQRIKEEISDDDIRVLGDSPNATSLKILSWMASQAKSSPHALRKVRELNACLSPEKLIKRIAVDSELLWLLVSAFALPEPQYRRVIAQRRKAEKKFRKMRNYLPPTGGLGHSGTPSSSSSSPVG